MRIVVVLLDSTIEEVMSFLAVYEKPQIFELLEFGLEKVPKLIHEELANKRAIDGVLFAFNNLDLVRDIGFAIEALRADPLTANVRRQIVVGGYPYVMTDIDDGEEEIQTGQPVADWDFIRRRSRTSRLPS